MRGNISPLKVFLNTSSFLFRTNPEHSPGPPNPADLQDFFNRIFKGGPPTDPATNGSFFPSSPPHHHPPGAGVPPFSPPPGQTGFHMPPGQRPEASEPWAEGGKPPRRRKKVRKPFQRWSLLTSVYRQSNTGTPMIMAMFVYCLSVGMPQCKLVSNCVDKLRSATRGRKSDWT